MSYVARKRLSFIDSNAKIFIKIIQSCSIMFSSNFSYQCHGRDDVKVRLTGAVLV